MENKITWLPGGPYYQLSLIIIIKEDIKNVLDNLIHKLTSLTKKIKFYDTKDTIKNKI